jgi:hypothetical protein
VRTHFTFKLASNHRHRALRLGQAAIAIAFCLVGTVSCSHLAPQSSPRPPVEASAESKSVGEAKSQATAPVSTPAVTTQSETTKKSIKATKNAKSAKANRPSTKKADSSKGMAKPAAKTAKLPARDPRNKDQSNKAQLEESAAPSALEAKFAQWKKPHHRMKIIEVKKSAPAKRAVASSGTSTRAKITFESATSDASRQAHQAETPAAEAKRLPQSLPAKAPDKEQKNEAPQSHKTQTVVVRTVSTD